MIVGMNNKKQCIHQELTPTHVGRGGALVESVPLDRRVVGSNPALAAT